MLNQLDAWEIAERCDYVKGSNSRAGSGGVIDSLFCVGAGLYFDAGSLARPPRRGDT